MSEAHEPIDPAEARTVLRADTPAADIADPDADLAFVSPDERYEMRAVLGEGGMGEVSLCRDRVIGREVALKAVLPTHENEAEIRARFIREARVQGQLEHPAIVPVYDFGADPAGRLYFTMKRVRGVTLESILESLRRGDEATARTYGMHKLLAAFVQVCLAVDYAHERGVLHRDLKPSNVMLGGYGEVYVLDWGLAKVRSASQSFDSMREMQTVSAVEGDRPAATAAGAVLGTPGYMAPEQLSDPEVDARADVYALGGILFEILTLERLNDGLDASAMLRRALEGVDARASVRAPGREVAPELEALCMRACARQPSERLASARALADAIEGYLAGDRDVALRRKMARQHVDRARAATDRREALRELGRAVTLAPADVDAVDMLTEMLTTPPKALPQEVVDAVEASRRESQRRMLPRVASLYAMAWVVFLPLPLSLGVVDPEGIALILGAWTLASLAALAGWRWFDRLHRSMWFLILTSSLAIAFTSTLFGPLVLLPTMVLMNTMGSLLVTRRDRRGFLLFCNAAALIVPTVLAWTGHHPVAHAVDGDRTLRIVVTAFTITRDRAFAFLTVIHVVLLGIGTYYATRYRDALTAVETQKQLQSWQLRHLVPAEATRALTAHERHST